MTNLAQILDTEARYVSTACLTVPSCVVNGLLRDVVLSARSEEDRNVRVRKLCELLLRGNAAGTRAGCPAALDHHLPDMVLHGIDDECAPTPR